MKINLNLFSILFALCLFSCLPVFAQQNATPKLTHTIQPQHYSVPAHAGVTAKFLSEDDLFSVTSAGIKNPIVINLGWLPAKPKTAYLARYKLRPKSLKSAANVYLMIREHESKTSPPITPYHKRDVRIREVQSTKNEQRIKRQLKFTTGSKTHYLSCFIVIAELKGEIQFSSFQLSNSTRLAEQSKMQANQEYQQMMQEIRAAAEARVPLTPRPLVFSRSQMKYPLGRNYYHQWNDRPLFASRDYRVPSPYITPLSSYKRTLEEVKKYDIDGLAFFPVTKGRMTMFEAHEQADVEGVQLLPEFFGAGGLPSLDAKIEILQRALKSPSVARINGKVLITSYRAQRLTPAQWKEVLSTLRQRVGDRFIFLPALTNVVALRKYFMAGEPIPREEIEKAQAFLRSYLDVCDGIYFNYAAAFRNVDHTFDAAFYREIFIPVFKSVLSEPAYKNKYLGLSAYKSHVAPERANSLFEDGTRTLRRSFEVAMKARPDVIILPEWDEQNENTSFRPTVYGSRSTERILRYYMSKIKQKAPTPVPGDDVSIPNLILSTRKFVTLGEKMMIELLNVPDSTSPDQYTVQLTLQDAKGRIVRSFDPVIFDATKLQEHRLYLDTIEIPNVRALVPVLRVHGYKGHNLVYDSGFHHIQIRATWNWDYLDVRQPLRDMLQPDSVHFAWATPVEKDKPLTLTGSVSSPEKLNLVEVLGDDDETYAVDPTDEFFRNDPNRDLFLIEYRSQNKLEMEGTLSLENATAEWLTHGTIIHQPKFIDKATRKQVYLKTPVSVHKRWIYLAIPKSQIETAELNFDFDKAKFSVSVRDVLGKKMIARAFENGLHISIRSYHRQIDMPRSLDTKKISFRVKIWPEIVTEQYHLRLTSVGGKLFRSRPLLLPEINDKTMQKLRVYSDSQKHGVDLEVAADRIPKLKYDFDPERGAVLLTRAGQPFWATLGGFSNTTTGRGAVNSLFTGRYPEKVKCSAPMWVTDGGAALEFDGIGTYLELPREALPWRGAFQMNFEINPTSDINQGLLINGTVGRQYGLAMEIRDGKLWASFVGTDRKVHQFATKLMVPPGEWSAIGIHYNFEEISFKVNGKTASFPLDVPAYNIGFTLFGVSWTGNWFSGRLRDLHIIHNAEFVQGETPRK